MYVTKNQGRSYMFSNADILRWVNECIFYECFIDLIGLCCHGSDESKIALGPKGFSVRLSDQKIVWYYIYQESCSWLINAPKHQSKALSSSSWYLFIHLVIVVKLPYSFSHVIWGSDNKLCRQLSLSVCRLCYSKINCCKSKPLLLENDS
jgi:hypothetical protein